jgi:hypothetical protein
VYAGVEAAVMDDGVARGAAGERFCAQSRS